MSFFAIRPVALLSLALGVATASADEERLLQTLVQKHLLTEKEAAAIQDEDAKKDQASSANKLKLSNSLTELRLYGDIRERYQYDNLKAAVYSPLPGTKTKYDPTGNQNSRWRFRLRLDADIKLGDQWFGGFELATSPSSDSSNQNYDGEFSKYSMYVSKAYLGYNPYAWLLLEVGKTTNPFYTTDLVWDPDVNPSGVFEQVAFHRFGSQAGSVAPHLAGGKSAVPIEPGGAPWELTLVAGQLFYNDNMEGGGKDPGIKQHDKTTDAYIFETQLIGSYAAHGVSFTLAPAWFIENAASLSGANNSVSFQDSALVTGAARDLNLILAPGDITFAIGGVRTKVFWDFAYNADGGKRYDDVYRMSTVRDAEGRQTKYHSAQDDIAWLAGVQVGQNAHAGDWSIVANYRQTGFSSIDPNLNDNEFALGYVNTQGCKVAVAYNLTDFAILQLAWYQAWRLRPNLIGGEATTDNAIANQNKSEILQVDLNIKF